jgi:hypothetical protein
MKSIALISDRNFHGRSRPMAKGHRCNWFIRHWTMTWAVPGAAPPHARRAERRLCHECGAEHPTGKSFPNSPRSSELVSITAKVTDPEGVSSVLLAYQVVSPGSYIPATLPLTTAQLNNYNTAPITNALNPAFEAAANWTTVSMHDDGLDGDAVAVMTFILSSFLCRAIEPWCAIESPALIREA